ncbi:MAG: hypothetical protein IPJ08_14570 [Burkholderiales bacterium]|nr:hypothetical protein [Burkholderiales bacterium]
MSRIANLNIMRTNIHSSKRQVSSKSSITPSREAMANAIRSAWERGEISQRQVGLDLGIHQSQFSKLVNGQFKEARGHAKRLFEYSIRKRASPHMEPFSDVDAAALRKGLTLRLMRAWDGTEEGAKALETILDGVTRLRASGTPVA